MKQLSTIAEVIATDVLIIGGGISGLLASIKAKDAVGKVLVVDKGGIGWAGQVPFSEATAPYFVLKTPKSISGGLQMLATA